MFCNTLDVSRKKTATKNVHLFVKSLNFWNLMYIVVLKLDPHQNEVIDNFTSKLLVKLCPILYNHVVVIMKNLGI